VKPILVGNTNNEGATTGATPLSLSSKLSNCPSHLAALVRRNANVPAWRYIYAGEFPNQSLGPCCVNATGAWHGSEIALVFGTTELKKKGEDTVEEKKLSKTLREAWTGFAKDPVHGLHKIGWPIYDASSEFHRTFSLVEC
jgi:cholinesterase